MLAQVPPWWLALAPALIPAQVPLQVLVQAQVLVPAQVVPLQAQALVPALMPPQAQAWGPQVPARARRRVQAPGRAAAVHGVVRQPARRLRAPQPSRKLARYA
nr:hypothetical protein [Achromobacter sp.]